MLLGRKQWIEVPTVVWLGEDGIIGNDNPFPVQPNTVMLILGFPIGVGDGYAICIGATRALPFQRLSNYGFRGVIQRAHYASDQERGHNNTCRSEVLKPCYARPPSSCRTQE